MTTNILSILLEKRPSAISNFKRRTKQKLGEYSDNGNLAKVRYIVEYLQEFIYQDQKKMFLDTNALYSDLKHKLFPYFQTLVYRKAGRKPKMSEEEMFFFRLPTKEEEIEETIRSIYIMLIEFFVNYVEKIQQRIGKQKAFYYKEFYFFKKGKITDEELVRQNRIHIYDKQLSKVVEICFQPRRYFVFIALFHKYFDERLIAKFLEYYEKGIAKIDKEVEKIMQDQYFTEAPKAKIQENTVLVFDDPIPW